MLDNKKSIQIKDEHSVRGTTLIPVAQLLRPLTRDTGWVSPSVFTVMSFKRLSGFSAPSGLFNSVLLKTRPFHRRS
ncbi:MAG: hypothetical protein ACLFUQ_06025 [Candidatus Izemoplasmataceae bacterium]